MTEKRNTVYFTIPSVWSIRTNKRNGRILMRWSNSINVNLWAHFNIICNCLVKKKCLLILKYIYIIIKLLMLTYWSNEVTSGRINGDYFNSTRFLFIKGENMIKIIINKCLYSICVRLSCEGHCFSICS